MNHQSTVQLRAEFLPTIAQRLPVPTYHRGLLVPRMLHIGVGGFHRAHFAAYTDELLSKGTSDWCIHGVGLTPGDERMAATMRAQDGLYTLIARGANDEEARVVGSITDYFHAPDGTAALCRRAAEHDYRVVSLTVTENGYHYTGDDRHLDVDHPAIARDLRSPDNPTTAVGVLVRIAQLRLEAGRALPTFLSCDNIPHNGSTLRRIVLSYARAVDPDVAVELERSGRFPNSMVDRITPATTEADREYVTDRWGVADAWPVVCEDFRQWYVEDDFAEGRPDWSEVGAVFVSDVTPFEQMKIRLLNGSHSALAYLSYLMGFRNVDKAMADDEVRTFVRRYMTEIEPTVGVVPGVDLGEYQAQLVERFANPAVSDQVIRLTEDGSRKIPNMMLEPVGELSQAGAGYDHAAFAIAAWIRFLGGADDAGGEIEVRDPDAEKLTEAAQRCEDTVDPFIALASVFPERLRTDPIFVGSVERWFRTIRERGTRSALQQLLAERQGDTDE